ncbi:MAG: chemotaxis protein CheA [Bacteroidota bacterium]
MKSEELKALFLAEARNHHEELNRLMTELEQDLAAGKQVDEIFRRLHTLKGDAAGMGFEGIAEVTHVLEDLFSEIKNNGWLMDKDDINYMYRALDKVGELIDSIKTEEKVRYKGLKAKLNLLLEKARLEQSGESSPVAVPERTPVEEKPETSDEKSPQETPKVNLEKENEEEIEAAESKREKAAKIAFSDFIQVPVNKLDDLMNLVGELAIEKDRIGTGGQDSNQKNTFNRLNRITSDLQYSVMGARLVKVELLFAKFHRIVRDVAKSEGKEVKLALEGTEIEIDRNVLQTISDSLIHIVRNAVSHGIETPEVRLKNGKAREGLLLLRAKNQKDGVVIEITDDGKGINQAIVKEKSIERGIFSRQTAERLTESEIIDTIFEPNFSTNTEVTEVSGRGVGMNVVRSAIDQIGGSIQIRTALGVGTTFSLSLPASMAVKNALLFLLNGDEYAIPLSYTEAVVSVPKSDLHRVAGGLMFTYQNRPISVAFLDDIFATDSIEGLAHKNFQQRLDTVDSQVLNMIIVTADDRLLGLVVDRLLQQKEIIEKPLVKPMENVPLFSGATILGNGNVCLILDTPNLIKTLFRTAGLRVIQNATVS